jgi:hypothetical protein
MTIINDDSSIVSERSSKLIDNARVVIYNGHMFIVQDTGVPYLDRLKAELLFVCSGWGVNPESL